MDSTKWRPVGKVDELYIYPLKSARGLIVDKAFCSKLGLQHGNMRDRTLMLVDNTGNFVHARKHPPMVLITAQVNDDELTLNAPNMPTLTIDLPEDVEELRVECRVWGTPVLGIDCGKKASEWFLQYLQQSVRLVYFPWTCETKRKVVEYGFYPLQDENDACTFSDEVPVMIVSDASLRELNSRITSEVTIRNFRSNILMSGCEAYDEDQWKYVKIGDATFRNIKPGIRCKFTTINPETGEYDKDMEPLKTLKTYRCCDTPEEKKAFGISPKFARCLAVDKTGNISKGDTVYAQP